MTNEETTPPADPASLTDPASLKAIVRANWTARSTAWDRWSDTIAQLAQRMNAPLLDAADLAPGQAVLDLASGIGEPALDIARRVGETGVVTATDMVPAMLVGARRRAAEAKLANIRFEIVDMEALPFADAAFDRVLCRFGIMFSPSADVALAEARRVLVPGGRAAYMVWGPRVDNTIFEVVQTVGAGFVAPPAPAMSSSAPRYSTIAGATPKHRKSDSESSCAPNSVEALRMRAARPSRPSTMPARMIAPTANSQRPTKA